MRISEKEEEGRNRCEDLKGVDCWREMLLCGGKSSEEVVATESAE